jgi:hypothetical protein
LSIKKSLKNNYLRDCESPVTAGPGCQASIGALVEFSSPANTGLQADVEVA